MTDLFRTKIVSKRQMTVPQRMMDILGLKQGDEIHFKVAKGKIVGVQPVHVAEGELEPDVAERFEQLENETTVEGLSDAVGQYVHPAQPLFPAGNLPGTRYSFAGYEAPGWRFSGTPDWFSQSTSHGTISGAFFEQLLKKRRCGPMNVQRDDMRLQDAVAEALANSFLDLSQVAVHTHNGEVTLTGTMHTYLEKLAAEVFTSSVYGVRNVRNEIEVASPSQTEEASGREQEGLEVRS
jgi:antitoxin component of MazEF toxin-antitoxin module